MLSIFFSCLILIVVVFVNASTAAAGYSYSDAILRLAGKSILSEYHLALKDNYGIIAFKGYENQVDSKLEFYTQGSLKSKNNKLLSSGNGQLTMIKPKLERIYSDLRQFSLSDIDNFEEEILDYMKYPKLLKSKVVTQQNKEDRVLRNDRIINSLPSRAVTEQNRFDFFENRLIPNIDELIKKNTTNIIVDEYIINNFNNRFESKSSLNTFFNSEVEYLLYGENSDYNNQSKFVGDLRLLRFSLNSLHIWSDSVKRNAVISAATAMSTAAAPITAIILAESWAWAETENDIKRLLDGNKVALYKSNDEWALSLQSVLNNVKLDKYVNPVKDSGMSYEKYLRLFLYFENRQVKLLRMMDLIQINIQGEFDETFYIQDCYVGLKFNASINGQEYSYVQTY
ncbi:MAG: DUF5702 domain-containing protein [Aminipila sp.]